MLPMLGLANVLADRILNSQTLRYFNLYGKNVPFYIALLYFAVSRNIASELNGGILYWVSYLFLPVTIQGSYSKAMS